MVNPLQKIRDKREARRAHESLTGDQRLYVHRISAAIWDEYGDIGESSATAEFIIRRDAEIKGFDEDGVVVASDLCLWIFRTLKQFKCASPTTAAVARLFEAAQ